jgi:iduronate 2-sulfatase
MASHGLNLHRGVGLPKSLGMVAGAFFALCSLAATASAGTIAEKPNFLVIVVDDLRAWGKESSLTGIEMPVLDGFARQSKVFSRTYAQYPVCGPSRNSFLSGLRPESTGAFLNTPHSIRKFIPDGAPLPGWFKEHGYTTVGMGKIFHSDQDSLSWTRFFDFPKDISGYQVAGTKPATEFLDRPEEGYPDGWMARTAAAWLKEEAGTSGQPFLLMVGLLKPHLPFVAPRAYWDAAGEGSALVPSPVSPPERSPDCSGHNGYELRDYDSIPKGTAPVGADKEAELRQGYAACMRFIDRQIGMILQALEATPHAGDTHVIIFGDNGFHLGENGFWGKDSVFETSLRTSMGIRLAAARTAPGRLPDPTTPLELVSLYPTLLQLAGLPAPYPLQGKSLFEMADEPAAAAFSVVQRHGKKIGFSVRDHRFRYTRWFDIGNGKQLAEELYDYTVPRPEAANLVGDPRLGDDRARLGGLMDRHLQASRYSPGSSFWGKPLNPPQ